jgi:hypothetical protein
MFAAKGADKIYTTIVEKLRKEVGTETAIIDPKQTCVHLIAQKDGPAYMGIHPRKDAVMITLKLNEAVKNKRVKKAEKVSANRWHIDLVVNAIDEVDDELTAWMTKAWELAMGKIKPTAVSSK